MERLRSPFAQKHRRLRVSRIVTSTALNPIIR